MIIFVFFAVLFVSIIVLHLVFIAMPQYNELCIHLVEPKGSYIRRWIAYRWVFVIAAALNHYIGYKYYIFSLDFTRLRRYRRSVDLNYLKLIPFLFTRRIRRITQRINNVTYSEFVRDKYEQKGIDKRQYQKRYLKE